MEHPGDAPHRHQTFAGPESVQGTALQHRKIHDAAHAAPVLAGIHAKAQLDGGVRHDRVRHQGGPLVAEDKAGAAGADLGKHLVESQVGAGQSAVLGVRFAEHVVGLLQHDEPLQHRGLRQPLQVRLEAEHQDVHEEGRGLL